MWFSVNLLYKYTHEHGSSKNPQWEESILLIEAESEDQAKAKALTFVKQEETSYLSATGESVCFQFDSIESVWEIGPYQPKSGDETFSRMLKDCEVKSLKEKLD